MVWLGRLRESVDMIHCAVTASTMNIGLEAQRTLP